MSSGSLLRQFWSDVQGSILSTEFVLLAVIVVFGLLTGLAALRDAVIAEMSDTAMAIDGFDQSFSIAPFSSALSSIPGSEFIDPEAWLVVCLKMSGSPILHRLMKAKHCQVGSAIHQKK